MENNRRNDQIYLNGKPLNGKDEPDHEPKRLRVVILLCTVVFLFSQICVVVSIQKVRDAEATIDQMSMTIAYQKLQIESLENRLADTGSTVRDDKSLYPRRPEPKSDVVQKGSKDPQKPENKSDPNPYNDPKPSDPGKAPSKNMEPNDDPGPGPGPINHPDEPVKRS